MPEHQNRSDNVEIEALSDEDLEQVAGGSVSDSDDLQPALGDSSSGPKCCSCESCS
jgi:hypothetical protein